MTARVCLVFILIHICWAEIITVQDVPTNFLTQEEYDFVARAVSPTYSSAVSFPHVTLDNVFPHSLIQQASGEFPNHHLYSKGVADGWGSWLNISRDSQIKYFLRNEELMKPATLELIRHMKSHSFVAFLEKMTGITDLWVDTTNNGGGCHQIGTGGFLSIHADFNRRSSDGMWRRVNILLYLNENWDDSYGGHLELWNSNVTEMIEKISVPANRLVIFSSSTSSFHGHPDPLQTPVGVYRKSIALYYYTVAPPPNARATDEVTNTQFRNRPAGAEHFKDSLEF